MGSDVRDRVIEVLSRRAGLAPAQANDETWLGDPGLGLDSVALLELVLECERSCRRRLAGELLQQQRLTVGRLTAALEAAPEAAPEEKDG